MPVSELERLATGGDAYAQDLLSRLKSITYTRLNEPDDFYDELPLTISEKDKDKPHGPTLIELAGNGDEKAIKRIKQIENRLRWYRTMAARAVDETLPEETKKWYMNKLFKLFPKKWLFYTGSREKLYIDDALRRIEYDERPTWLYLLFRNVFVVCNLNYLQEYCPDISYNAVFIDRRKGKPRKGHLYLALQQAIEIDLNDIGSFQYLLTSRKHDSRVESWATNKPWKFERWRNDPKNQALITGEWRKPEIPDPFTQRDFTDDSEDDRADIVREYLAKLSPRDQIIISAEKGEIIELSQRLGISANSLYKRRHDLREKLKKKILEEKKQ